MNFRRLGKTDYRISSIGFGAWAIGGTWGEVDDRESLAALHKALDLGVNFFDTADVYGDGHSEQLLARLRRERQEPFIVATKAGRRLDPHTAAGYTRQNLRGFIERSLSNLGVGALDLLQLHCPPGELYELRRGVRHSGRLSARGAAAGLRRERRDGGRSAERRSPPQRRHRADHLQCLPAQARRGVLRRCARTRRGHHRAGAARQRPLSGKLRRESVFAADDHRNFNRHGEAFDRGETFSGVDYETGLDAVERCAPCCRRA